MQYNVKNDSSVVLVVIGREARIFRNLFITTAVLFLMTAIEDAMLMAKFR
jgi:hypothetical protein